MDSVSLSLLASVSNLQKDFVVVFEGDKVIFTNNSFNTFFNVGSTQQYNDGFGAFVNNFVPHPSYFHKDKISKGESWVEAIEKLDENDKVVSMLSQTYEPHAFSVKVDSSVEGYSVVVFKDITQDLIKRIMTKSRTNIDEHSGAYAKTYFQHMAKSYQEAAVFNEKIVSILSIVIPKEDIDFKKFVDELVVMIRHDDMLVRWGENKFILVYMVDDKQNAEKVLRKFQNITSNDAFSVYDCRLTLHVQNKDEQLSSFIKRV